MLRTVFIASTLLLSVNAGAIPIANEPFDGFLGRGLAPGGGGGRLDSNRWAVSGFSDGDSAHGDTRLGGDFARGVASAPVRGGGLYSFALPDGGVGLGVQATASDFTPGALTWRVQNGRDREWRDLRIDFDFWFRNDGERASELRLDASTTGQAGDWTSIESVTRMTPAEADDGAWQRDPVSAALPFASFAPLSTLLLRFGFSDASSSGARDELALASLRLSAADEPQPTQPLPSPPVGLLMLLPGLLALSARRRMTRA